MLTSETFIEEIVEKYPYLVSELKKHNITCIACGEPVWGTLQQLAERKSIMNLNDIVSHMNDLIEKKGKG